jgi:hypothetical protein
MTASKDVDIFYNQVYVEDRASGTSPNYGIFIAITSEYNVNIQHNKVYQKKTGLLTALNSGMIVVWDQIAAVISNNIVISKADNIVYGIAELITGDVVVGAVSINNNYIEFASLIGTALTIGLEENDKNIADGSEIIGNNVIGYKKNNPTGNGTTHGILANCGINMDIKYNNVSYFREGLVVKTGLQDTYTSGGVVYNTLLDNSNGIYIRGINGINIFNNTVAHSNVIYTNTFGNGILATENATTELSKNIIGKNNIIESKLNIGNLIYLDADAIEGSSFTYESVFGGLYVLGLDSTNYSTLLEAQANGWLQNSIDTNPNLNSELIPEVGSPTIGSGENLGNDYKTGLDSSTNWGDDNNIPSVVTKDQSGDWDIGAYVS